MLTLILSLALTLVLEGLFALIWGVRGKGDWLLLLLVNAVTNPIVVSLYGLGLNGWPAVAALEEGGSLRCVSGGKTVFSCRIRGGFARIGREEVEVLTPEVGELRRAED